MRNCQKLENDQRKMIISNKRIKQLFLQAACPAMVRLSGMKSKARPSCQHNHLKKHHLMIFFMVLPVLGCQVKRQTKLSKIIPKTYHFLTFYVITTLTSPMRHEVKKPGQAVIAQSFQKIQFLDFLCHNQSQDVRHQFKRHKVKNISTIIPKNTIY